MNEASQKNEKKKGFWAAIWESMTKTGGCCGGGGNCCGPAQPEPEPPLGSGPALALKGASWTWYPEADPAQAAPPGTRYFRKQITIPAGAKISKATFAGTADNSFTLFVNGKDAGHGDNSAEGWRNPVELDVTALVSPGVNQLAIAAVNAGDKPSPAGHALFPEDPQHPCRRNHPESHFRRHRRQQLHALH